jgi:hypothetical protein
MSLSLLIASFDFPRSLVPLFGGADIAVIIKFVLFLLVICVPAIGKLLLGMKASQANQAGRVGPPPPKPAPPVQSEIEAFLQRASAKNEPSSSRSQRPRQVRSKPTEAPIRAEIVRERRVGGQVEQHVKQYLNEDEFVRRSQKLGEEVGEADDKIERHLKSVFDHSVGTLANVPGETAAAPRSKLADVAPETTFATSTFDMVALFSNPSNIRQAIIISEVLNRHTDRW